jgi:hypothetical protein
MMVGEEEITGVMEEDMRTVFCKTSTHNQDQARTKMVIALE